jgi:hypothetical protein
MPSTLYARRPANPDGNVDYTGPAAAEDAYERAKQAKQDVLAAQTALVETSLQAQRDFERAKQAKQDALAAQAALAKTSLQVQTDIEATKKANKDAYERAKQAKQDALAAQAALAKTSLQAQTDMEATKKANKDAYERAKQAKQDALAAQTALVKPSMQAQTDMEATKKAKEDLELAREVLRRQEEDFEQQNQLTALTAMKAKQDVLAANIALQATKELGYQGALTSETSYVVSLQVPPKKRMKRKGAIDEDGEDFIGWVNNNN